MPTPPPKTGPAQEKLTNKDKNPCLKKDRKCGDGADIIRIESLRELAVSLIFFSKTQKIAEELMARFC